MAVVRSVAQAGWADQGELHRFRGEVYDCFTARADALFDLVDGLCTPVTVGGVAYLSLAPGARRGHGAAYAAVAAGRIDTDMLRDLLAAARPDHWQADFAVDTTVWMRSDAECSPQRGFSYHPSRHSAGQPIVAGWCYSWLVALSAGADSWTAPLDTRRVLVGENANVVAAQQIQQVLPRLGRLSAPALFAFDGGYDPVQLTVELTGAGAQIVVRVRDDRVFFARPPTRPPGGRSGAPRRHGAKFSCTDPSTWPVPDVALDITDDVYGQVSVAAWHQLHPKQRTYREPGGALRIIEGTLIRLHVSRLPGRRDREPKTVWLWWHSDDPASLDLNRVWRAYLRRFDIEHTFRFAKQSLGWTTPKLRSPEQADRWTWLSSPRSPSYAWPARWSAITGCPGSHRNQHTPSPQAASGRVSAIYYHRSAPRPATRNPPGPAPDARKAPDPRPPNATPPSRKTRSRPRASETHVKREA
ncbi:transposase [Actinoplanes sp. Pm04-4]|uniref:Transposase n=1 Tax=Paractinoplanes pyxinae TaxID=2997416 RepID=A0ABT4BGP0_9ACTN|nr:transposase [Actinoplanes pyxinae]MCY1145709.1 transposase [Actinoplanes pyxinae]